MKFLQKDNPYRSLARICLYFSIGLCALYAVFCVLFYALTKDATFYHVDGTLNFLGRNYLLLTLAGGALVLLFSLFTVWQGSKGHMVFPVNILENFRRYGFLICQLVRRDFKTKYKRSVLGVLWSFLNPLLMMAVQFVVFSTIFRSGNFKDFPVYLISGIVLFNFFSESSSVGLTAITTNASLINKAYVPKYIYPLCKVLSSLINLGFSMIPLFAIILLRYFTAGTIPAISPMYLLLIFDLVCMLLFCFGVSLLLSALMVFFRDIQFLWGVIITIWTYLTPLFYDAAQMQLPAAVMSVYKLNPMYQFITFARSIILDGVSPGIYSYLACILCALIPLVIGGFVFQKTQKKFVLYL